MTDCNHQTLYWDIKTGRANCVACGMVVGRQEPPPPRLRVVK